MTGFKSPIAGGQGALLIPAIKSPDYAPGVAGWTVNRDGSAELNNVTVRGTVIAGTFQGTNFVINPAGAFFYSGAPAAGNLTASVAPSSGTDGFGNRYLGGMATYTYAAGVPVNATQHSGSGILYYAWAGSSWGITQAHVAIGTGTNLELSATGGVKSISPFTADTLDVIGPVTATGGDPTDRTLITTDAWNVPGALANGWANAGGGLASLQYSLLPSDAVHLIGVISPAASTSTAFYTLPAGYRPAVSQDMPVGFHTATGAGQGAFLRVNTAGQCSILNSTTSTGTVCVNSVIPLGPSS